jgi:hypothetical protein
MALLSHRPAFTRTVACGLSLASTAPIAGLRQTNGCAPPDVRVEMAGEPAGTVVPPTGAPWYVSADRDVSGAPLLVIWRTASGDYRLQYLEGATFDVAGDGAVVRASWRAPLTAVDAATYLLGPVLGFVMRLRGIVPLHASGVVIDGRAVLFAGEAGAGKSTTAAAFAALGHPLLSDDIVPLGPGAPMRAFPGYPRVSMWADSAAGLFGPSALLPSFSDTYAKRYLDLLEHGYRFHDAPVPIDTVYLLRPRASGLEVPSIAGLSPREALMGLVPNTYGGYLLDARMRAEEFEVLGSLVARVPVRALTFGEDLVNLRAACAWVARAVRARSGECAAHV